LVVPAHHGQTSPLIEFSDAIFSDNDQTKSFLITVPYRRLRPSA